MSTIKVDTYLTRGGASEIAIDKLKGASSASSISVVAEGGTTTTNLQQGLLKVWTNFNAGQSTRDSFNQGSLTDNGSGNYNVNFTNNFNAASWSGSGNCQQGDTVTPGTSYMDVLQIYKTQQTNFASVMCNLNFTNTSVGDAVYVQVLLSGDLA